MSTHQERDASAGEPLAFTSVTITYPKFLITEFLNPSLQRYYEFTQDEMKALEECDRESFYRRCVPFSTAFATATYAAIKTGELHSASKEDR